MSWGLAVLLAPDKLRRRERPALILFVSFAAANHSATFAVLLAIVAAAAIVHLLYRDIVAASAVWRGAGSLDVV